MSRTVAVLARLLPLAGLLLALAVTSPLPPADAAPGRARKADDPPQDLILIVDVSGSMTGKFTPPGKDTKVNASDENGIRWDGLQFVVDIARPEDRIALVLFSGDAAVVTRAVDDSGFVHLNREYLDKMRRRKLSGRLLLKAILEDLQEQEKSGWKDDQAERAFRINNKDFLLWWGTSNVLALETVSKGLGGSKGLLGELRADSQGWVFLFTDGVEEGPFDQPGDRRWTQVKGHAAPTGFADYAYIKNLKRVRENKREYEEQVDKLIQEFPKAKVPIFCFALGEYCDEKLLRAIATRSNAGGRVGGYYNPLDSEKLLVDLQKVAWELRQYWRLPLEAKAGTGKETFETPPLGPWHEAGILLYRKAAGALAPQEGDVAAPAVGGRALEGLEPLTSRSHWYYPLGPGHRAWATLRGDAPLKLEVARRTGQEAQAVLALRTEQPLFRYDEPKDGSSYSPLDAIPFRVAFLPPDKDKTFRAEDFEIVAELTPARAAGKERKTPRTVILKPAPARGKGGDREFREVEEVVLDPNPGQVAKEELFGLYDVDVTIRWKRGKPPFLERRLLRQTIEIKRYPTLEVPAEPVVLTNASANTVRATQKVKLDVNREPSQQVADLTVRLKKPVGAETRAAMEGTFQFSEKVAVRGREAEFWVELPAREWAALAAGAYRDGSITLAGAGGEATVKLNVKKNPYAVRVPKAALALKFSGAKPSVADGKLEASLATSLDTQEKAWLSATPGRPRRPETETVLKLEDDQKKSRPFTVQGLGEPVLLRKDADGKQVPLELHVERPDGLAAGTYRGKVYVVGPNIEPAKEVSVEVVRGRARLDAPAIVDFDCSAWTKENKLIQGEVHGLVLEPGAGAAEPVWLSSTREAVPRLTEKQEVKFRSPRTGQSVHVTVEGLGKLEPVPAKDSSKEPGTIKLALRSEKTVEPGLYEATFHLVGDGVVSRPVTLRVLVDQVRVFRENAQGKPLPVDGEIHLVALAGAPLQCRLAFRSSLSDENYLSGLREKLKTHLPRPLVAFRQTEKDDWLSLSLGVPPETNGDRLLIEAKKVPSCVREGSYLAQLTFDLASPGKAPQLVDQYVRVQVVHFGARPEQPGTLRLKPKSGPCGPVFEGDVKLVTDVSEKDARAQWEVTLQPAGQAKAGRAPKLDVVRADNDQSVLRGNVSRDSVTSKSPCQLKVRADCADLPPGLYHARLCFSSTLEGPPADGAPIANPRKGAPYFLDVEVLVPGRVVTASPVAPGKGERYRVDEEVTLRVEVIAYGCPPGRGEVRGAGPSSAVAVGEADRGPERPPQQQPGLGRTVHRYAVKVRPDRAGPNPFQVRWERFCPSAKDQTHDAVPVTPTVDAVGVIRVEDAAGRPARIVFAGEEVILRAKVSPELARPSGELALHVVPLQENAEPIPVTLHDDGAHEHADLTRGDGEFSGRFRFEKDKQRFGPYEIRFRGDPPGGRRLQAAPLSVGFEYEQPVSEDKMLYGGGDTSKGLLFMKSNLESVKVPDVVRIVNQDKHECRWRATVRFPRTVEASRNLKDKNLAVLETTEKFDGDIHLDAQLRCQRCTGTVQEDGRGLTGTLKNGEELELALLASLSEDALKKIYDENTDDHNTLGHPNGMVVQLELRWMDGDKVVAERVLRAPVVITTSSWRLYGLIVGGIGLASLGGGGWWAYRFWKRRGRTTGVKPRAGQEGDLSAAPGPSTPPSAADARSRRLPKEMPEETPPDAGPPPDLSAGLDDI